MVFAFACKNAGGFVDSGCTAVCDCHITHRLSPTPRLYSIKRSPRGAVVVCGDRVITETEMPESIAQQTADWLNDRKKHGLTNHA